MSNELKKPTVFTEIATKCDFCDFSTKDPKAMERHIKIRQRDSETQCDKCPMKFCTVGSMMFHATEKHTRQKISEYKCEKCHFVSGKADELYRHQQNAKVFSGGPHLCSDCTFKNFIVWLEYPFYYSFMMQTTGGRNKTTFVISKMN